jgi:hypothetical protein
MLLCIGLLLPLHLASQHAATSQSMVSRLVRLNLRCYMKNGMEATTKIMSPKAILAGKKKDEATKRISLCLASSTFSATRNKSQNTF